jgi:prolyl-tRNA synthetase
MIHRALLGSYERFIGIMLEHYAGELPLWLAPVQAIVLPISDPLQRLRRSVADALRENGLRVELDDRSESIGRKIREAELRKIPLHADRRRARGSGRDGGRCASTVREIWAASRCGSSLSGYTRPR